MIHHLGELTGLKQAFKRGKASNSGIKLNFAISKKSKKIKFCNNSNIKVTQINTFVVT